MDICNAKNSTKIPFKKFKRLIGSWKGSLRYLDYSTGKPYTMPADLDISNIEKTNSFIFANKYPDEPKANSADTIMLSNDGKLFGTEIIKSIKKLENGNTEIITEELGNDGNDNKQATIRHTYTFSKTKFSNRKDIQFLGQTEWIKRHEYTYNRYKAK